MNSLSKNLFSLISVKLFSNIMKVGQFEIL